MVEVFNNPTAIEAILQLSTQDGSVRQIDLEDLGQFTSISTAVFDRNGSRYTLYYDDSSRHWLPFQATVEPVTKYEE